MFSISIKGDPCGYAAPGPYIYETKVLDFNIYAHQSSSPLPETPVTVMSQLIDMKA